MSITDREFWTSIHGIIFGAGFLLAFAGGVVGLSTFRADWMTSEGGQASLRKLIGVTGAMAVLAWTTVLIGTYVIYPWYRAEPPFGATDLSLQEYPRSHLLSSAQTVGWHEFGMEWKEHVAWFAPILATAVAYAVTRQRGSLLNDSSLRRMLLVLLSVSFFCAVIAGLFGAFINKAAPLR